MFKKILSNVYVRPLIHTILIPAYTLIAFCLGFVGGLREAAKATVEACDAILEM